MFYYPSFISSLHKIFDHFQRLIIWLETLLQTCLHEISLTKVTLIQDELNWVENEKNISLLLKQFHELFHPNTRRGRKLRYLQRCKMML